MLHSQSTQFIHDSVVCMTRKQTVCVSPDRASASGEALAQSVGRVLLVYSNKPLFCQKPSFAKNTAFYSTVLSGEERTTSTSRTQEKEGESRPRSQAARLGAWRGAG